MSLQAHKRIQVSVPVAHSDYFKDLIGLDDPANRVGFVSAFTWDYISNFLSADNLAGGLGWRGSWCDSRKLGHGEKYAGKTNQTPTHTCKTMITKTSRTPIHTWKTIITLQVTPFILVDVFTGVLIGIGGVLLILSAAIHLFCKPSARHF